MIGSTLAVLSLMTGILPESVHGQIEPGRQANPPFEIIYAGRSADSDKSPSTVTESASGQSPAVADQKNYRTTNHPATAARKNKAARLADSTVAEIDAKTSRLITESRDSWRRGLMDNSSYAAWLDIATTAQLRLAQRQGDSERAVRTLRQQTAIWDEAAARLAEFNEPGSSGWLADLLHSQVMALRSKLQYSVALGNALHDQDVQAYYQLAARHLDQRRQDFRLGEGSAADLLSAARLVDEQLAIPVENDSDEPDASAVTVPVFELRGTTALRQSLEEVHRPVFLATYPVAVSFRDHAEDRAEIERAAQVIGYLETSSDHRNPAEFLDQLNQNAETMMTLQLQRIQVGTATPGGMLRQWWLHESMASMATSRTEANQEFHQSQIQRLFQIREAASSLRDRRGRNAADVAAAEVLWAVQQLDHQPAANRTARSATVSSATTESSVIDILAK